MSENIEHIKRRHNKEIEKLQNNCPHINKTKEKYGNSTWWDDNGDDYIVVESICLDCGKVLIPTGKFQ